jgi:hypothetical protein
MFTVFEGQITYAGNLSEALRMIASCKSVREGVLRITSDTATGMIGVFLGRYVTGAITIIDGDVRTDAISRLLFVKNGTFAFLDAVDEPLQELKQGLAIELEAVIDALEESSGDLPLSPDSLITMGGATGDTMKVIDTTAEFEGVPEEQQVKRARATYQRLVSVSERERQERERQERENASNPVESEQPRTAFYVTDYGRDHIRNLLHNKLTAEQEKMVATMPTKAERVAREEFDSRPPAPPSHKRQQFHRLSKWQEDARLFAIIFWGLFLAIVAGAMWWYRDKLF